MLELCSIASGSSGNCICVGTDESHVLIDAGISGKKIENGLNEMDMKASDMEGILVTHEHIDHISGLGVMSRRYHLPIYATPGTIKAIKNVKSVGKIDDELFHPVNAGEEFKIGDMTLEPMPISHDAAEPVAYTIKNENHKMAVVTDLGTYDEALIEKLQGLDGLLLEANHDINMLQTGAYPYPLKQRILGDSGHLSNERSGQLLCRRGQHFARGQGHHLHARARALPPHRASLSGPAARHCAEHDDRRKPCARVPARGARQSVQPHQQEGQGVLRRAAQAARHGP